MIRQCAQHVLKKSNRIKKRRATTYIPQRGKGWVAIPSTASDISLDFFFTGINSNINSEELIDELEKDCQEYQDYDINPELLDESDTFIENNQDKIPQDHSNFKTDNSKYDYRRAKYLAEKIYEKNYWSNRRKNLADLYVSSIHDGQRISSCNSTKLGLFKCIKCNKKDFIFKECCGCPKNGGSKFLCLDGCDTSARYKAKGAD
jgi:hypothetical protein